MALLLLQGTPTWIKLVVMNQAGVQIHFKVRVDAPFEKLFRAVCLRQNMEQSACKFVWDDVLLQPLETPQFRSMIDGDIIDMIVHQIGD